MSLTSSQASVGFQSGLSEPDSELLRSVKSTHSAVASLRNTGPASPAMTTSELSPPIVSRQMELLPMSSAAVSPARTSRAPASRWGSLENALASGSNTPASFANYDPASSSWKTSQHCLLEGL